MARLGELTTEQKQQLRSGRVTVTWERGKSTQIDLQSSEKRLTVLTTFEGVFRKSGELLRALNQSTRMTTVGVFLHLDSGHIAIRTTTLCILEEEELPEPQIEDIVQGQYSRPVELLRDEIRAAARS